MGVVTPPSSHPIDVDECATLPGVCGAARCENVDGSFLCLCPTDGHEFDPVTGTCGGGVTQPPPPGVSSDPTMCYSPACGVLAANVSRQQCCCAVGWAWGPRCEQEAACPKDGTGGIWGWGGQGGQWGQWGDTGGVSPPLSPIRPPGRPHAVRDLRGAVGSEVRGVCGVNGVRGSVGSRGSMGSVG